MPQKLGEHAQSLVGEVLVDEWLLPGKRFGRATRRLIVVPYTWRGNFGEKLCHRRQAALPFPFIYGVVRLPEDQLSARRHRSRGRR